MAGDCNIYILIYIYIYVCVCVKFLILTSNFSYVMEPPAVHTVTIILQEVLGRTNRLLSLI
jgi:hypothetical protein